MCPINPSSNSSTRSITSRRKNPVYMAFRVAMVAADPRWLGGIHREHLFQVLGCDRRSLDQAIAIACKRDMVSVSGDWVIAVVPGAPVNGGVA